MIRTAMKRSKVSFGALTMGLGYADQSSTILYLNGKSREFEGFGCSGTQLSRRLDAQRSKSCALADRVS